MVLRWVLYSSYLHNLFHRNTH